MNNIAGVKIDLSTSFLNQFVIKSSIKKYFLKSVINKVFSTLINKNTEWKAQI